MRNFCHSCKYCTLTINFSSVTKTNPSIDYVFGVRLRNVLNTSRRHLENVLTRTVQLYYTYWKSLDDVSKTSWRRLEDVLKTFLQDVLKTFWIRFRKSSWRRLEGRRLEDVFNMSWRRMTKTNIFFLIKTSWRRLLKTKMKDVSKLLDHGARSISWRYSVWPQHFMIPVQTSWTVVCNKWARGSISITEEF